MKNIRYVVTAVNAEGNRTLAENRNHLHTYTTWTEANDQLLGILEANSPETIEQYMGKDLQVRPVECYQTGDPMTCWFDDTIESLTAEWQEFCRSNGYPQVSADEWIHMVESSLEIEPLTEDHIFYAKQFVNRWEAAETKP